MSFWHCWCWEWELCLGHLCSQSREFLGAAERCREVYSVYSGIPCWSTQHSHSLSLFSLKIQLCQWFQSQALPHPFPHFLIPVFSCGNSCCQHLQSLNLMMKMEKKNPKIQPLTTPHVPVCKNWPHSSRSFKMNHQPSSGKIPGKLKEQEKLQAARERGK